MTGREEEGGEDSKKERKKEGGREAQAERALNLSSPATADIQYKDSKGLG